jgi:hypothetical protein
MICEAEREVVRGRREREEDHPRADRRDAG